MLQTFTFWLSVLAVLSAYLCLSVAFRFYEEGKRQRAHPLESPETSFDAFNIAPRIVACAGVAVGAISVLALIVCWRIDADAFTWYLSALGFTSGLIASVIGIIRHYEETARRRYFDSETPGTALNVSAIAPQIRQVRANHLAALRARPHSTSYRLSLVAAARQFVARLSFFRHGRAEHEIQKNAF